MRPLVECVPNFSEGRDKSKVDAIIAAMHVDGAYLLAHEMDADHNRCVVTLAGEREAIQEAAIRGVGPRLGAADVVPFTPLQGATLDDCVAIARHVGVEIWKRYAVPVYLYEAAATSAERRNLEDVRRGG